MANQVYRLGDNIVAYIGTGPTVYMTPQQAREFGQALVDNANDADTTPFVNSTLPTFHGRTLDDD